MGRLQEKLKQISSGIDEVLNQSKNGQVPDILQKINQNKPWFKVDYQLVSLQQLKFCIRLIENEGLDYSKGKWIAFILVDKYPLHGAMAVLYMLKFGFRVKVKYQGSENIFLACFLFQHLGEDVEIIPREVPIKAYDAFVMGENIFQHKKSFDYFKKKPFFQFPKMFSVAIIKNEAGEDALQQVSNAISFNFGFSPETVQHLFLPSGYKLSQLLDVLSKNKPNALNHLYFNQYELLKSNYLINSISHFDTGSLIFRESEIPLQQVGLVSYSFYNQIDEVYKLIGNDDEIYLAYTAEESFDDNEQVKIRSLNSGWYLFDPFKNELFSRFKDFLRTVGHEG